MRLVLVYNFQSKKTKRLVRLFFFGGGGGGLEADQAVYKEVRNRRVIVVAYS